MKLQDIKITHKSVIFLHSDKKPSEKKRLRKIIFSSIKKSKIQGINLTKETEDSYTENHKTLLKEMKEDVSMWKRVPCSWVGRLNIVEVPVHPGRTTESARSPSKSQRHFLQIEKNQSWNSYDLRDPKQPKQSAEGQSWRPHASWLQNLPQSYSNQHSTVLTWRWTYRP